MNNKKKNEMGGGWRARIAGLLVCALFAGVFGTIGVGALRSLTATLHGAWTVRSWQPVPAEVLESELRTSHDSEGSTLYSVRARYRYEWAGRSYESTLVGLPGMGSDNIDGWHQAWAERLNAARDGGPPVRAWVDAQHPERAVLDPHLRWRQVAFMMPFAVLFPLVALGALYAAWWSVAHRNHTEAQADELASPDDDWRGTRPLNTPRHIPQHGALALWLFALVLCVMTLPAIGMASSPSAPGVVSLVAGAFALVGLAMLRMAIKATQRSWTYRGAYASFQPARPRAGNSFEACWTLPARAPSTESAPAPTRLRVAQYRIDDSGSGAVERRVEDLTQEARPQPDPFGGTRLQARFELPADAPSRGARRSGEKVEWRLEWLNVQEDIVMAVPIPVEATANVDDAAADRFARGAVSAKLDIPASTVEGPMLPLPAGVSLQEQPHALVLGFGQTGWRWFAAITAVALAIAFTRSAMWLAAPLLALVLHAVSKRWTLQVQDDGIMVERTSWLWRSRISLPASRLPGLYQQLLYSRNTGQGMAPFHALWARGVDYGSDLRLTPGLPGNGALLIAQMLRWAVAQRSGRFSPGELRADASNLSRPGWGWALWLLGVVAMLQ